MAIVNPGAVPNSPVAVSRYRPGLTMLSKRFSYLDQDTAVLERSFAVAVALFLRLDLGLLDRVYLDKAIEVLLVAPVAAEVVVPDCPGGRVDDSRILSAGELDEQTRGLAAVKPRGAVHGLGQPEPAARRRDGGRVVEFRFDLDDVRHGFVSPCSFECGGKRSEGRSVARVVDFLPR